MQRDMDKFDSDHDQALRRIWFLGDVHGSFAHIGRALLHAAQEPRWLVFLGDIDIDHKPFREILAPMRQSYRDVQVTFIHGNHDADTYEHWKMLHDCGDAQPLHGRVLDLGGVRVAGLGGNFMGRVWSPPAPATFDNKKQAMNRGPYQWRGGQRPSPSLNAAIYPDDVLALSKMRADILVTHEAPSCHHHGFEAIDELARSMGVVRSFHGHQHDDLSEKYVKHRNRLGFDASAVNYCGIKNGLGEVVCQGEAGW
jgi:predicted phosphodiesterase